jgi:ribosomal-protein-alanine N-acetyltransferase
VIVLELVTPRLLLVPLTPAIARLLAEHPAAADPFLPARRAAGWPSSELLEVLPGYVEAAAEDPSVVGWGAWLLVLRGCRPAVVGDAGFHAPPDERGEVELAYGLAPGYRGRGLATEAVTALVDHATRDPRVTSVVATTRADNHRSARVLERCGFVPVETDPRHVRWWRPAIGPAFRPPLAWPPRSPAPAPRPVPGTPPGPRRRG